MLNQLFDIRSQSVTKWITIHILIGALATITPWSIIILFYLVLFNALILLTKPTKNQYLSFAIVYLCSFDVIGRMAKCTPFIPYEISKYLLFALLVAALMQKQSRTSIAYWMLLLILPAAFYDFSGETELNDLINNALGPIDLCLAVAYFYKQPFSTKELKTLVILLLYTCVMVLTFAYVKTPDYDDLNLTLNAQSTTSGGFGSNQVSTILGLGIFIIAAFLISDWSLTSYKLLDAFLLGIFALQGLLTFSRGGMVGALLALFVMVAVMTLKGRSTAQFQKIALYGVLILIVGFTAFTIVNNVTGNKLLYRYQGETEGTLGGYREGDLNSATSGRYDIWVGDMDLWMENIVFGNGVGASKYLRLLNEGTTAHIELSRLLAEHGLLGLIFFLIWLSLFFIILTNKTQPIHKGLLCALFTIALLTSFHAAMRTYITPLLTGISMITVVPNTISNKRNRPYLMNSSEEVL